MLEAERILNAEQYERMCYIHFHLQRTIARRDAQLHGLLGWSVHGTTHRSVPEPRVETLAEELDSCNGARRRYFGEDAIPGIHWTALS